ATRYTDATVSADTGYTYRVRADNDYSVSGWTNYLDVKTWQSIPAAPTGLTAAATPLSWTQITLHWTDNSTNATALEIYRKSGSGAYALVGLVVPGTTSYTDNGLSADTAYTYQVRAANNYWPSAYTNEVTATTH